MAETIPMASQNCVLLEIGPTNYTSQSSHSPTVSQHCLSLQIKYLGSRVQVTWSQVPIAEPRTKESYLWYTNLGECCAF